MTYRGRLKETIPLGCVHFCELIVLDQNHQLVFWRTFDPSEGPFWEYLGVDQASLDELQVLAVVHEQRTEERETNLVLILLEGPGTAVRRRIDERSSRVLPWLEQANRGGGLGVDVSFADWGLRPEGGTEEYWRRCRRFLGSGLLFCPAAGALVTDGSGRYLLQRRTDDGTWGILGGGLEVGETIAQAAVREVFEESGLKVRLVRLLSVAVGQEAVVQYPNGDRLAFWGFLFLAVIEGGTAAADHQETLELGWFSLDEIVRLPNKNRYLEASFRNATNERPRVFGR